MATTRKPLVLKKEDLRRNTAALFSKLEKDPAERERFIHDPTGQLSEKVVKQKLEGQVISDANRVLFAMLANDQFREWLDAYKARPKGKKVTHEQFSRDFCDAVLKFGDSDLLRAVVKQAGDGSGLPAFSKVAQQLFTGPEKSTVTSPATPSTSDKSANSSQNFNNKQTGIQLGDTTLVDPALLRAVIGQLMAYAQELKAAGKLADVGATIR